MDYRQLQADALVVDSHNDTIVAHIRRGNLSLSGRSERHRHSGVISFLRGHEDPRPGAADIQIDYPKMREGGIDVGFFAVDVTLARGNHLAYALDAFGYFLDDLEESGADVVVVRRAISNSSSKFGYLTNTLNMNRSCCASGSG